ncbi:MAG: hypothetical protein KC646_12025 [Candidatus Cloacimonetes bacterium]|nr:hypothetical protein [Candidatus Cloacimonadota bacterium]
MQILINTEVIDIDTDNINNFSQLIQALETNTLEPNNNFITSIKLNDQILNDQEELDYADFPISKINNLQLFASSPKQLVLDGLVLAETILPEMHTIIAQILVCFEQGQISKAYKEFQVITDGLTWFSTIFHGLTEHFSDDLMDKCLREHAFMTNGNKLSNIFETLIQSQENSDETLFKDLLEYDLLETIGLLCENHKNFLVEIN